MKTSSKIQWSEEQEAIFKTFRVSDKNFVVNAVAGSGKTTTGVECVRRDKTNDIAYVAFNAHIKQELANRIGDQENVSVYTYHGLGLRALKKALKKVTIDESKLDQIVSKYVNVKIDGYLYTQLKRLVSLSKQYCVSEQADLERLVDHHTLEIRGIENRIFDLVPKVLKDSRDNSSSVDFDDMIWLPRELQIKMPKFDIMLIDEAQDTNMVQQWLALESADRLVVIGDKNQAIYGFRGSDVASMDRLRDALAKTKRGVKDRSLSYTRRCPKSHVELAQQIVPQIKAVDSAPDGEILSLTQEKACEMMKPGDLALCRVNAALVETAYNLIKNDIKAVIRGRDIGKGITKLIEKAAKKAGTDDMKSVLAIATEMCYTEAEKYRAIPFGRGENRAEAVIDKLECLTHVSVKANTATEVKNRVEKLFSDFEDDGSPKSAVVLGTVHRTKGLEASRVFVLRPELIPHPMSKKGWEVQQESNLGYVAVTRALYNKDSDGQLVFVGQKPPLFGGPKLETKFQKEQEKRGF